MDPPTSIARDLLVATTTPSILFLHTNVPADRVSDEANELCFKTRVLAAVDSLYNFLESIPAPGDGVLSSGLAEWHRARFEELKTEPRHLHLFDPSKLVVKVVEDLANSLRINYKLDINKKTRVIPLDFIREWHETLIKNIRADDSFIADFA
jgi:hypothetical protein